MKLTRRADAETAPQHKRSVRDAAPAVRPEPVRGDTQTKKEASTIRSQMLAWQKTLNYVSGSIVIAYGGASLKKVELDQWKSKLRETLNQMEAAT